jgi:5-methylcytosine-specific restriction protein A
VLPSEDAAADHWEGNRAVIYVNRYERDPKARAACVKIFGAVCAVCGLDFGKAYGEIGIGFIHVHHLNPLSVTGKKHRVNPLNDLRPVCPNCHEMLHRRSPPFSIDELKAKVAT